MSENIKQIRSADEWDGLVSKNVTLVDFWAPWCGPCRLQLPILEKIAAAFAGRVQVVKVNVDENQPLAGRFGVSSIPTLYVFKDGAEVERFTGVQDEKTLANALNNVLGRKLNESSV